MNRTIEKSFEQAFQAKTEISKQEKNRKIHSINVIIIKDTIKIEAVDMDRVDHIMCKK